MAGQSSVYNDLHGHKKASSSSSKKDLLVSLLFLVLVFFLQPQAWRQCRLIRVACGGNLLLINFSPLTIYCLARRHIGRAVLNMSEIDIILTLEEIVLLFI